MAVLRLDTNYSVLAVLDAAQQRIQSTAMIIQCVFQPYKREMENKLSTAS